MSALRPTRRPREGAAPDRRGRGHAVRPVPLAVAVSRAVMLVTLGVALVAPDVLRQHAVLLLGLGFLVGLPHGAVDHVLPLRHRWVRPGRTALPAVIAAYVAAAALTFAALLTAGPVVLPLLLVVSVLHFGAADLDATDPRTAEVDPRGHSGRMLDAAARGAPVLAGPLLARPAEVTGHFVDLGWRGVPPVAVLVTAGAVLLALSVVGAARSWRRGGPAVAGETLLLLALFLLVPPLAAFGVYFGAWHGLRHTARLIADDPANVSDLAAGLVVRPVLRFVGLAALPTAAALTTVLTLVGLAAGNADLVAPVFAVLLALTVPHVIVVAWWDAHGPARAPATGLHA